MIKFVTSGFNNFYGPAGEGGEGGGGDAGAGTAPAAPAGDAGAGAGSGEQGGSFYPGRQPQDDGEGDEGKAGAGDGTGGEGEGGEGGEDDGLTDAERELLNEGKPQVGADGKPIVQPKAPAPANTVKLDPESLAELRSTLRPNQQREQAPQNMSPEEVAKTFNPVVVTPETLKSFGFAEATPEQVAGFQNFANATVKNAVSIARVLIQREAERFEQFLTPISSHIQTQQAEHAKNEFYSTYPILKSYENIVKAAANEVSPTNADGAQKSRQQIYKEVASRTMQTLRSLNVQVTGKPAAGANHSAGQARSVGRPNALPGPGRSGSSGPAGGKPNNPDADIYSRG